MAKDTWLRTKLGDGEPETIFVVHKPHDEYWKENHKSRLDHKSGVDHKSKLREVREYKKTGTKQNVQNRVMTHSRRMAWHNNALCVRNRDNEANKQENKIV